MAQLFFYIFISPLIWPPIKLAMLLLPKMRERFRIERKLRKEAYRLLSQKRGEKRILVFHAASAGEFEQLKPLLSIINRNKYFVFQTFSSPTIYNKEKETDLFDAACYHPEDSIISALLFFWRVQPLAYVVNRHDLWPSHIMASSALKIKTIFVNANIYENSLRFKFPFRSANKTLFKTFDLILCGSQRIHRHIFKLAPGAKVKVTGDSRFDQVIIRREKNKDRRYFSDNVLDRRNIILGSVISSDFDVVLGGIDTFYHNFPDTKDKYRIIVVPHEVSPKDIDEAKEWLEKYGLSYSIYSKSMSAGQSDALIIDKVGILADLYRFGYCAYVGAGFGAGVHSVIEPAAHGIPVFYGPNYFILDEACRMADENVACVIKCSSDVCGFLSRINDQQIQKSEAQKTLKFVESVGRVSETVWKEIIDVLN